MANTPNIRFKGFTDDWEQRKLGDLIEKYEDPVETPHVGYERIGIRSHAKGTFHSYVEAGKELDTAKMHRVAANKFILNITFAWEHAVAITDESDVGKLVSHRFPQFSFGADLKSLFFKYVMLDKKFREHLELSSPGGAGRNRVLKIDDMLKYDVKLPSINEQIKIGEYFDNFDRLIAFHQRKCDEVRQLKKFMLQKMFPKSGELIPEIRFAGFTDDWEQRKFGAIAQRISNIGISNKDVPSVEYEDVISEQGLLNKDICQKESIKTGIKFSEEEVLYGKLRPYLHNWLNPDFQGIAVGDWWVLKPVNSDKNFLYRLIQTPQFDDIANQSSGTKMPRADWKLISGTEFCIPTDVEEQQKIGGYFSNLDHLITLHQHKCDELKEVKRFMLQNMFPQKG